MIRAIKKFLINESLLNYWKTFSEKLFFKVSQAQRTSTVLEFTYLFKSLFEGGIHQLASTLIKSPHQFQWRNNRFQSRP